MRGHREKTAIYEPGGESSPDTKSADALILNFSASKIIKNKCLLFKSHPVYGIFCYSSLSRLRHIPNQLILTTICEVSTISLFPLYYHPHFSDEQTEAKKINCTSQDKMNRKEQSWDLNLYSLVPETSVLTNVLGYFCLSKKKSQTFLGKYINKI